MRKLRTNVEDQENQIKWYTVEGPGKNGAKVFRTEEKKKYYVKFYFHVTMSWVIL